MSNIEVKITLSEVPLHLYQILAGFTLLKKSGQLSFSLKKLAPDAPERLPYNMMAVQVNGKKIIYDMNDGYDNLLMHGESYTDFYNDILSRCDVLFKRSFNADMNSRLSSPEKIRKTPPNFLVTVPGNPAHIPVPCDPQREKVKKLIRMLPATEYYNGYCFEKNFIAPPVMNKEPKILFMARLWDPAGDFPGQLNEEKSEERRIINESRADCIRTCRKEFGSRFFGGITYSEFAAKQYPDLILENADLGKKNKYLDYMKRFDIHISTMGLHRSTGWKFAEYIAASKAVVSEPLFYENSGGLQNGKNYLTFQNSSDCVQRIYELFNDDRRFEMMKHNEEYYKSNMKCEEFVRKTLETV